MKCKGSEHTNPSLPYASYSRNTSASAVALENRAIKNYLDVTIPQTADQLVKPTIYLSLSYTWVSYFREWLV